LKSFVRAGNDAIIWDAGTFVGRGAGMRITTAFLARGFQALALAFEAGFDFAALVRLGSVS